MQGDSVARDDSLQVALARSDAVARVQRAWEAQRPRNPVVAIAQAEIRRRIDEWARFSPDTAAAFAGLKERIGRLGDPNERAEMMVLFAVLEEAGETQVARIRTDLTALCDMALAPLGPTVLQRGGGRISAID